MSSVVLPGAIEAAQARDGAEAGNGRRVVVLTTAAEIEPLRSRWEALRPGPRADPDSFLAVVETRATIVRPHVFAMLHGGELEAILVARLEDHDFRCRLGNRTVFHRRTRALAVDYGGALRDGSGAPWGPLVASLGAALRDGVAGVAHFRCLDETSDLLREIRAQVPWHRRNESEAPALHWTVDLPASFDEFLSRAGSHARKALRHDRRALDRAFPGEVSFRRTTQAADVPAFCRRAESIARETYQRGLDAGFVHDDEYEARLAAAARRGCLRAYELVVAGRPRSFWIGELRDGTHHVDSTGYAPDFARWSPGKALRLEVVRDMIAEGARRMDFGFGDAEYKRQFGAESRSEHDVYVFAPGGRGAWLNAVRSGVTWADEGARAVVARVRAGDALRRLSRRRASRRLASRPPPQSAGGGGE